jgi:hypothetical protein
VVLPASDALGWPWLSSSRSLGEDLRVACVDRSLVLHHTSAAATTVPTCHGSRESLRHVEATGGHLLQIAVGAFAHTCQSRIASRSSRETS